MSVDSGSFDIDEWTNQLISFEDSSSICVTSRYIINRAAKSLQIISTRKKDASEKVCKNMPEERHASLREGQEVNEARIRQFDSSYGTYFHLLLAAMNAAYAIGIWYLVKKSRWKRAHASNF